MTSLKEKLKQHKAEKNNAVGTVSAGINDGIDTGDASLMDISTKSSKYMELLVGDCTPDPSQPRKSFSSETLAELTANIEAIGQLQPIVVRKGEESGKYIIVAGERRWRAISASQTLNKVKAIYERSPLDELDILKIQIHENESREDVNALESAQAIIRGVELCKNIDAAKDDKEAAKILMLRPSAVSIARAIVKGPEAIQRLSIDNVTQDPATLYNLSRAYKGDQQATLDLVRKIKEGAVEGGLRGASETLLANASPPKKGKAKGTEGNGLPSKIEGKVLGAKTAGTLSSMGIDSLERVPKGVNLVVTINGSIYNCFLKDDAAKKLVSLYGDDKNESKK